MGNNEISYNEMIKILNTNSLIHSYYCNLIENGISEEVAECLSVDLGLGIITEEQISEQIKKYEELDKLSNTMKEEEK